MKNNKIVIIVLILILLTVFFAIVKYAVNENSLISPALQVVSGQKAVPSEAPSIIVAPKTYIFDSSTDLKKELDSINPQVLDSDFE